MLVPAIKSRYMQRYGKEELSLDGRGGPAGTGIYGGKAGIIQTGLCLIPGVWDDQG